MGLCDVCGKFIKARHGCAEHDQHETINVKLREKLDPSKDGLKMWRAYTRHSSPQLLDSMKLRCTTDPLPWYKFETWETDLDRQLLSLRWDYWIEQEESALATTPPVRPEFSFLGYFPTSEPVRS